MKNILSILFLFICGITFSQESVMRVNPFVSSNINKQFIPISNNGKNIFSTKNRKDGHYEWKGAYRGVLLTEFADSLASYFNSHSSIDSGSSTPQGIDDVLGVGQALTTDRTIDLGGTGLFIGGTSGFGLSFSDDYVSTLGDWSIVANGNRIAVNDGANTAFFDNTAHNGFFGINTTAPDADESLKVNGNAVISNSSALTSLIATGEDASSELQIKSNSVNGLSLRYNPSESSGGIITGYNGLELYTQANDGNIIIDPNGVGSINLYELIKLINIPTYANEAAAVIASLPQNTVYKTSTGELRIKL